MRHIQVPAGLEAQDWETICGCHLFQEVSHEVIVGLCGGRRPLTVEARQVIFSQGDQADGFYLVLQGWVKLYRVTRSGEEAVVGVFTRGESFAEPVFFLGGHYPATAEAASRVRLLKIDAARFSAAIEGNNRLAATLLGSIVQQTDRLFHEISSLKLLSTSRRLAQFLLTQIPTGATTARVVLPHEKALIAGRLGMTPESLSRALATLRRHGVMVERDHVFIANVSALSDFKMAARTAALAGSPRSAAREREGA